MLVDVSGYIHIVEVRVVMERARNLIFVAQLMPWELGVTVGLGTLVYYMIKRCH